ncbi:hypothetical protein [Alloactinosynnema sp. L-07]|nr:hypothetical protein [Alloactinosynnema sp. L-07]
MTRPDLTHERLLFERWVSTFFGHSPGDFAEEEIGPTYPLGLLGLFARRRFADADARTMSAYVADVFPRLEIEDTGSGCGLAVAGRSPVGG